MHVIELIRAKKRIKAKECHCVCDALRRYVYPNLKNGSPWNKYGNQIQKLITSDIKGKFSLFYWCIDNGHEIDGGNYGDQMREIRLQYIDALIEYWKDKP